MDEVWGGLDLQLQATDIAGDDLHDPFWPDLNEYVLAGDDGACFGVSDGLVGMDTGGFLAEDGHLMQVQQEPVYSSSSLSSKRSLSIDSGNTSSPRFALDDHAALAATAAGIFSPSSSHRPAAPAPPRDAFANDDDEAIMRAMMAVLSSASPSSSESSSPPPPPLRREDKGTTTVQPGVGNRHVMAKSTSLAAVVAPERTTSLTSAGSGGRQQQQDEARAAAGGNSNQVYHMMSERKRREKLNDSFHTLRSLLPPCSKKDKTTVLINAASYLKTLEAQVSELEEKNSKLERHVPREDDGAAAAATAARAAHRRAKVQISRAPSEDQVNLTVMVMVECDIVDLVLHVLECLRWMAGVSVLSVDADTYSPQVLLKAIASIKLQITDGECWNEASFHEAMTKAVHDATSSSSSCAAQAPLVVAA